MSDNSETATKPPADVRKTSAEEAAEAFARDTKDHEMTVLHDDGLYRHLLCKKPGTSSYWFEIVTWPGGLLVNGDMESFLFTIPEPDLFPLFRGFGPNPHYWAQKVRAGRTREYSEAVTRQHVLDVLAEIDDDDSSPEGLATAMRGSMLDPDVTCQEECVRFALDEFTYLPPDAEPDDQPWRFHDTWEWDLSDYTHQFLWYCSAIPWAIGQYRKAKAPAKASATETVSVAGGAL